MHSLRTKVAFLTVCVTTIAVVIVSLFSVMFIVRSEHHRSEQLLLLLCETGARNLDYYFTNVEKSINKVSRFAEDDLMNTDENDFDGHVERVREYFDTIAHRTSGVLTYYYRIDPEYSDTEKGFWYTDTSGTGFTEHEVTNIKDFDTSDTSRLVWFTVPKASGKAAWLPPYISENLDLRVISYNVPIYDRGQFVGVIGIEIDYSMMAEQVESIRLYENGYAFINDAEGRLIYHPDIDVASCDPDELPKPPDGIVSGKTFVTYTYQGVKKKAAWLELVNGMQLNVAVPVSEMNGQWKDLILSIIIASVAVMIILMLIAMWLTQQVTKPLQDLMDAAEQVDRGNYDLKLKYDRDDEIGRLTNTFNKLAGDMKEHINSLNRQAYVDALTSVKNRGAFSSYLEELQKKMEDSLGGIRYAVGVFDCDDLKLVNDRYGHEKGDIYLKRASGLICRVFQHSPVFRTGGDEFAVILQNEDLKNMDSLVEEFATAADAINAENPDPWEQVHVTMGTAVYDPAIDHAVAETIRRADKEMYENKRGRKAQ